MLEAKHFSGGLVGGGLEARTSPHCVHTAHRACIGRKGHLESPVVTETSVFGKSNEIFNESRHWQGIRL